MAKAKPATLTRKLSHAKLSKEINAAYKAYKAKEPRSADEGDSVAH
jgi:hypothetical protein